MTSSAILPAVNGTPPAPPLFLLPPGPPPHLRSPPPMGGGGAAVVVLGSLIDRFLIRHTGENHLAQVLLTVGVAFVIGDVALAVWGGDRLKGPGPVALRGAMGLPGG